MPKIVLTATLFALIHSAAWAQTKVEIATRLVGYDLRQATGQPSEDTILPRIVVASGSEGLIAVTREYRYPKEFNTKGKPTVIRTAFLGIRVPIYIRETDGAIRYLARAEICEREDSNDPLSTVAKTTTSFQGQAQFDKPVVVVIGAPGGRTARLELLMTRP